MKRDYKRRVLLTLPVPMSDVSSTFCRALLGDSGMEVLFSLLAVGGIQSSKALTR